MMIPCKAQRRGKLWPNVNGVPFSFPNGGQSFFFAFHFLPFGLIKPCDRIVFLLLFDYQMPFPLPYLISNQSSSPINLATNSPKWKLSVHIPKQSMPFPLPPCPAKILFMAVHKWSFGQGKSPPFPLPFCQGQKSPKNGRSATDGNGQTPHNFGGIPFFYHNHIPFIFSFHKANFLKNNFFKNVNNSYLIFGLKFIAF